jgi:hypothetical protein
MSLTGVKEQTMRGSKKSMKKPTPGPLKAKLREKALQGAKKKPKKK